MNKFSIAIVAVLTLSMIAGCGGGSPSQSPAQSGAQASSGDVTLTEENAAFAEPIVDNLLAGIKDKDYAVFSRDFSDAMKSAITEDSFISLADMLATKIGEYEKRNFIHATSMTKNGIVSTVVAYAALYSNEPGDVVITVIFSGDNEKKVDGLDFNSPKLREQ
jgi:hypothetical protein